ncbi:hypothetical protein R1flu_009881 [Riccia fluitans]|uniref:SHSP domain-containing protein n=1 Tax=Riccia fluitans TaxID=41844 RepID=A0ABD1Z4H3_9MARC
MNNSSGKNYCRIRSRSHTFDGVHNGETLLTCSVFFSTVDATSNAYDTNLKVDMTGLNRDEVKLTVEDDRILQITGERSKEKDEKTDKWHRVERSHGRFLRRFPLPDNANVEKIHAKVEDGVLTVTVPKSDKRRRTVHRQIDIK